MHECYEFCYFLFNFVISTNSWNLSTFLHRKSNRTYNNNNNYYILQEDITLKCRYN